MPSPTCVATLLASKPRKGKTDAGITLQQETSFNLQQHHALLSTAKNHEICLVMSANNSCCSYATICGISLKLHCSNFLQMSALMRHEHWNQLPQWHQQERLSCHISWNLTTAFGGLPHAVCKASRATSFRTGPFQALWRIPVSLQERVISAPLWWADFGRGF